jgi:hypothetical protein
MSLASGIFTQDHSIRKRSWGVEHSFARVSFFRPSVLVGGTMSGIEATWAAVFEVKLTEGHAFPAKLKPEWEEFRVR